MSVYAAITGGVLALMAQRSLEPPWPLYFLIVLTFLGFSLTIRWTYAFEKHRKSVDTIINKLGLSKVQVSGTSEVNLTMDIPEMKLWKFSVIFRARYLFPFFYFVVLILFTVFFQGWIRWAAVVSLVIVSFLAIGYIFSLKDIKKQYKVTKR